MLSILIPIYDFDVRSFVLELHQQALQLPVAWEIILYDDGSPEECKKGNRELGLLQGIQYQELNENIGRAAIRNALAQQAQFEYLLFMDCDSATVFSSFLQNYHQHLSPKTILCGGRSYTPEPPADPSWRLHWYYGRQREVRSAAERQNQSYHGFMTNNFVIPKATFLNIKLDERIKNYGHEDTLLGLKLEQDQVSIRHIENPLLHIGLDANQQWLGKQEQAIQNLFWLHQQYPALGTPALKTWKILRKTGVMLVAYPFLERYEQRMKQHLMDSENPRLWIFDLLKVLWLEVSFRGKW